MTEAALAVDLGGTDLRVAVVDAAGTVLAFAAEPTPRVGPAAGAGRIATLAERVRAEADRPIVGMGIAAPGPIDIPAQVLLGPPTLPGWHDVPLAAMLGERLGLPVRLENDGNAAALGEWRFGAGRGVSSLVFVTVSTGIGGGVVVDGHLLHGRRGMAAEIGHMTITGEGEPCFCGAVGCFEAVACGTALGRRAARATTPGDASTLRRLAGDADPSGRDVIEAARLGDPLALALVEEEGRWLGVGFTNLLHLYGPEVVVVGGGISNGLDLLRPAIERTVAARAMPPYRDIPIAPAQLGRHAGLAGAASLVLATTAA
ncbi:MAG: ROK family protein [Amaricoccus sp.]